MPPLPRHGTTRRYKAGCHCDRCTEKNTIDKARERERKRIAAGGVPTVGTRVPTARNVPTSKGANADPVPTRGPIEQAARDALADYDGDKVAVLRREIAWAIARSMDDPKHGVSSSLFQMFRQALTDLIGERAPKDGEADAIRNLMESIGSTRRGRGKTAIPDATQPQP